MVSRPPTLKLIIYWWVENDKKFVGSIKCICLHFYAGLKMRNQNLKILSRREKIFDLKNIINRSKNYEGLVDYGQVGNF